jgi:hypothetical protein
MEATFSVNLATGFSVGYFLNLIWLPGLIRGYFLSLSELLVLLEATSSVYPSYWFYWRLLSQSALATRFNWRLLSQSALATRFNWRLLSQSALATRFYWKLLSQFI